jgi:hypothetical protein
MMDRTTPPTSLSAALVCPRAVAADRPAYFVMAVFGIRFAVKPTNRPQVRHGAKVFYNVNRWPRITRWRI